MEAKIHLIMRLHFSFSIKSRWSYVTKYWSMKYKQKSWMAYLLKRLLKRSWFNWENSFILLFFGGKKPLIFLMYPGFSPWPSPNGFHSIRVILCILLVSVPSISYIVNSWSCTSHQAIPLSYKLAFLIISLALSIAVFWHCQSKMTQTELLKFFLLLEFRYDGENLISHIES